MTDQNTSRKYCILGASGGIGQALTRRLAERGDAVAIVGRNPEKLEPLADATGARSVNCDDISFDAIEAAVHTAAESLGGLDGVANCIGSLLLKPAHITTPDEFEETMRVNATSAFATVRAAAKLMQRSGGGSIVLVSSAAAQIGLTNHEAIAAAKGAIIGLTRAAAATYAGKKVRVNAVAPGLTETPLTERITQTEASRKASLAMHALGRFGAPEDLAAALAWLLGAESSWVTGQVLGVDGGLGHVRSRSG